MMRHIIWKQFWFFAKFDFVRLAKCFKFDNFQISKIYKVFYDFQVCEIRDLVAFATWKHYCNSHKMTIHKI